MNNQKIVEEVMYEYNMKIHQMQEQFGSKIMEFNEDIEWTETELMAYDLGFAKALMIMIDIMKENGVK